MKCYRSNVLNSCRRPPSNYGKPYLLNAVPFYTHRGDFLNITVMCSSEKPCEFPAVLFANPRDDFVKEKRRKKWERKINAANAANTLDI